MSSNKKQPPIFFKRKSLSSQKSPLRTQSQKEPRQRLTTQTRLTRKAVPPHTLEDDKEEGASPSLDDFTFYSRESFSPESRASRPVSNVGENEWLKVSDISRSSSRIQNAACNWGDAAKATTSSPPSTPSYNESQNKEPASRYDQENLQEETSARVPTPTPYLPNSKSGTAIIGSGYLDKKGPNQSLHTTKTASYEELTQIALEGRTGTAEQTEMKRLWKLDPSLVLSSEFPFSLAENNPELKRTPKRHTPGLSDDTTFPPLVTKDMNKDGFKRSASFPSATSLNTSSLFSAQTQIQASQNSGKSCQIRLPESFPGVYISRPPPEEPQTENVSDEELGSLEQKRADTPSAPFMERNKGLNESRSRVMDRLRVPQASVKPPSSTRSSPGPQNFNTDDDEPMAMRWASSEFLAARVVSELDTAFTQECSQDDDNSERVQSCIIPKCSNSLATPRMNTFYSDESHSVAFSSIHKYSKSMPNLPTSAKPPRRVFVTFDSNFPRATAVNLQGKSEIAERCRTLNRKMDKPGVKRPEKKNPGIKIAQTSPVQKTVMIRQWVESCSPQGVKKRPTKFQVHTK